MAAEANLMEAGTRSSALRRSALIAVEIAITVVALVVLFRGIDIPETARSFRKANYWLLAPAIVFLILDLEFPRLGIIRIDAFDQVFVDLRQSMQ